MKKGISISLSLLMLTAVLHLSVATHYCEGREMATVVSLSGKLASCDMKCSEIELPLTGTNFTKHCCDNVVTFCGVDNNYIPSFSFLPESLQYNFQVLAIPTVLFANSHTGLISLNTSLSPPGALMSTNVDLSNICVYRI
jgi:hypothetical protein